MQISKNLCKKISIISFISLVPLLSFTQNAKGIPNVPDFPSISISAGPSMPTISSPSLGSKFYKPDIKASYKPNSYPSMIISNSNKLPEKSKNQTIVNTSSKSNLITSLSSGLNNELTAQDLLQLNNSGAFSSLYDVLSTSTNTKNLSSENVMLESILTELKNIKSEQEKLNSKLQSNKNEILSYNQISKTGNSHILKFSMNGKDLLNTVRTVWFSKKETDGTFLLTGDRKYLDKNKTKDETIYLLFKAELPKGSIYQYSVEPTVIQPQEDKNSDFYKISKLKNLHAQKTGNLVSLVDTANSDKLEILLDVGD